MKASSAQYVTLQTLYRARAKEDLAEVKRALSVLLAGLGVDEARIGEEEIGTFVKHAGYLKIIRGRSLREEEEKSALKGQVGACITFYPLASRDILSFPSFYIHRVDYCLRCLCRNSR
jgi:amyloid beta precursor protein binding protein 1